jgi:hypothetical protein
LGEHQLFGERSRILPGVVDHHRHVDGAELLVDRSSSESITRWDKKPVAVKKATPVMMATSVAM